MWLRLVVMSGLLLGCEQLVGIKDPGVGGTDPIPRPDADLPGMDSSSACAAIPNFGAPTSFGAADVIAVAVGDLNHDGILDIVYTDHSEVRIMRGTSGGNFMAAQNFGSGVVATNLRIADLDGDGFQDLITFDGSLVGMAGTSVVRAHRQSTVTAGTFLAAQTFSAGSPGALLDVVVAPKLDGGALPDLVVSTLNGVFPYFAVEASPGTFSQGTALITASASAEQLVSATDIDGDGFTDTAYATSGGLKIIYNQTAAPGTFDPPQLIGSGAITNAGFGRFSLNAPRKDVVVLGSTTTVALFVQNTPRTFSLQDASAIDNLDPGQGFRLIVLDLNDDGTDDVISQRTFAVQCTVGTFYPDDGQGGDPLLMYGEGSPDVGEGGAAFADFDTNGKPDFVQPADQFLKVYLQ